MNLNLEGKIGVVSGAGGGIGKSIAYEMAKEGMDVYILDINEEKANATAAEIGAATGRTIIPVKINICNNDELKGFYDSNCKGQKIYALVNNAGIARDNLFLRMKDEELDSVLDVNLRAAMKLTKLFVPGMMKAEEGRIINISSIVGIHGSYGQTNYAASKAGLIGFTKSLAREVGSRGITTNAIAPGYIKTEMTEKVSDKVKEAFLKQIPLGYAGESKDVASIVTFLLSDAARYITGAVIQVDGGMGM